MLTDQARPTPANTTTDHAHQPSEGTTMTLAGAPDHLAARPVAASVDELLEGATRVGTFVPADARSGSPFERVIVDGEPCVVKYVHPDHDFIMRANGDIGCLPVRAWETGLMDSVPDLIDHATIGAARWGRNGWGGALLMRDISTELVPIGDAPVSEELHLGCLDHLAGLSARHWGFTDGHGLLEPTQRWGYFSPQALAADEALGFPEPVPRIATEGWQRFAGRAPADVRTVVEALSRDASPLVAALATTPLTFLHGDWKFGNIGRHADGRTVLIDWTYVGQGPICHELAWYLALNRARLPVGHTKETTTADLRDALERRGVATDGWWDRQLALCLLGGMVQFGWEKAFGDDDEFGWWCERAREGARHL